jgi:hypothetical protein
MRVRIHYKNGQVPEVDPAQDVVALHCWCWLQRETKKSSEKGASPLEADQAAVVSSRMGKR